MPILSAADKDWLSAWREADRTPVFVSDDPHVWRMLVAMWQQDTIEFRYWGGSKPGTTRRIRPLGVFRSSTFLGLYVEGHCEAAGERRTFRLDRVEWISD